MENLEIRDSYRGYPICIGDGHGKRYIMPYEWFNYEGEPRYCACNYLGKYLHEMGKDAQEYYDFVYLGITDPKDRPRCANPNCNREKVFRTLTCGYNETCGRRECYYVYASIVQNKDDVKERVHDGLRAVWNDPNSTFNTKEYHESLSEASREKWRTYIREGRYEEICGKLGAVISSAWADPNSGYNTQEYRDAISREMIENWKDETYRNNVLPKFLAMITSEEHRKLVSETFKRCWADPEWRDNQIKSIADGVRAAFKRPEVLETRSRISKKLWQDPEYARKVSEGISRFWRKFWSNPEAYPDVYESFLNYWKSGGAFGRLIESGRGTNSRFESGIHKSSKASEQNYMSSYEKLFMELLDEDNAVITYKSQPLRIPYIDPDGVERSYYPDFLVEFTTGFMLIEVKPNQFIDDPYNIAKFMAGEKYAEEHGWDWLVVTEDLLF